MKVWIKYAVRASWRSFSLSHTSWPKELARQARVLLLGVTTIALMNGCVGQLSELNSGLSDNYRTPGCESLSSEEAKNACLSMPTRAGSATSPLALTPNPVSTTYDEFTDTTTYSIKDIVLNALFTLSAYTIKGNENTAILIHAKTVETWRWLKCYGINWLVDGKPGPALATEHVDGQIVPTAVGTFVFETIRQVLPRSSFVALAQAKTLKGRLCNDIFTFTDEQIQSLRKLAETAGFIGPDP